MLSMILLMVPLEKLITLVGTKKFHITLNSRGKWLMFKYSIFINHKIVCIEVNKCNCNLFNQFIILYTIIITIKFE